MRVIRMSKKTIRNMFKDGAVSFRLSRDEVRVYLFYSFKLDTNLFTFKFTKEDSDGAYVSRQPDVVKFFAKLYKKQDVIVTSLLHEAAEETQVQTPSPRHLSDHDKQIAQTYIGNLVGPKFVQNGITMVMTENGPMSMAELNDTIRKASFSRIKNAISEIFASRQPDEISQYQEEFNSIEQGDVEGIEKLYDKVQYNFGN